jgi:hypothetical protein
MDPKGKNFFWRNKMNWENLDKIYKYAYRQDRLKIAKKMGYNFISEATVKLYRKYRSTNKVASILNVSTAAVLSELKSLGEPRMSRGGCRFTIPTPQTWKSKSFDKKKFYLGKLCHRGHNWNKTQKSIRLLSTGACTMCQHITNTNRYKTGLKGSDNGLSNFSGEAIRK